MLYYRMLILGCAFLAVVLAFLGIYNVFVGSRALALRNLKLYTMPLAEQREIARPKSFKERGLKFLGGIGKVFTQGKRIKKIQRELLQARLMMRAEEFIGASIVTGVILFLLIFLLTRMLIVAVIVGVIGFELPNIMVKRRRAQINKSITDDLPQALTIISNGLRAGFSFPQAMAVVGREMEGPLADEFKQVFRENTLGKPLPDALLSLVERTDSDDIEMLVTALLIQRQVGGNLAEVMDNISHTIRERIRLKGEIKTLTAQQRLSAAIVVILPIAVGVLINLINPGYMQPLLQNSIGLLILLLGAVLMIIGIIFIRRIINIEV